MSLWVNENGTMKEIATDKDSTGANKYIRNLVYCKWSYNNVAQQGYQGYQGITAATLGLTKTILVDKKTGSGQSGSYSYPSRDISIKDLDESYKKTIYTGTFPRNMCPNAAIVSQIRTDTLISSDTGLVLKQYFISNTAEFDKFLEVGGSFSSVVGCGYPIADDYSNNSSKSSDPRNWSSKVELRAMGECLDGINYRFYVVLARTSDITEQAALTTKLYSYHRLNSPGFDYKWTGTYLVQHIPSYTEETIE